MHLFPIVKHYAVLDDIIILFCRWKQHPKHIKISVNPDTSRFFVSDAKEFDSVAVSEHCMKILLYQ